MGSNLLAGFVSGVALSALGLALRLLATSPYPPQVLFDTLTRLLGTPGTFQLVHSIFGYGQGGKLAAFTGVAIAWLGGLTLLGLAPPLLASALVLAGAVLLLPLPWAVLYAAVYLALRLALRPLRDDPGRRRALATLGGGSLALVGLGGFAIWRAVFAPPAPVAASAARRALPPGVTAQDDLYYISKNLEAFDPKLTEASWTLVVGGLARTPKTYRLADLKAFPAVDSERTLACISNPVGGPLIGNVIWTGFRVKDLVRDVGVQGGARHIVWKSADGYVESLPLGQALEDDVLLVYAANGEPLSQRHGFPLRVSIPGRYGMKQPRWITSIELAAEEPVSYWAARGWSKTAFVETLSRIDEPIEGKPVTAGRPLTMRGIAYAGSRAITAVEVSTDGGRSWRAAELEPLRSPHAWTRWSLPWTPTAGRHELVVRAYANAVRQTEGARDALPEGSTGWHRFVANAS